MDVVIRVDESTWSTRVPVQLEWNWIIPTKLVLVSNPVNKIVDWLRETFAFFSMTNPNNL